MAARVQQREDLYSKYRDVSNTYVNFFSLRKTYVIEYGYGTSHGFTDGDGSSVYTKIGKDLMCCVEAQASRF